MVNQEVVENEKDLPTKFVSALNNLVKNKLDENKDTVETYREVIKSHVYNKKFRTNKPQMMGIITNILELLAWLGERKVAMRDLKPDNLLVIGDKSKYPTFLKSSSQFKMGLIDVETAAVIEAEEGEQIKQPQIGGTPFFATPSHLLKNKYLKATFEDLPGILHYQDWYAAIVMIYYVVTGERLFIQTAKLFPGIKKKVKAAIKNKETFPKIVEDLSRIFWRSATHEFKLKTDKKKMLLEAVEIAIPKNAVKMLGKDILKEIEKLSQKIKHIVSSQNKFKGDKNHQYLLQSDYNRISQLKTKWENETAVPKATPEDRAEVTKFLQGLMKLKLQSEQQELILELLKKHKPTISAHALMKLMFNIVLESMYKDEWGPFSAADSTGDNSQGDDESLYGVTIL
jgi:serine/threonine protein kinase